MPVICHLRAPRGQTLDAEFYSNVLRRLMENIQHKQLEFARQCYWSALTKPLT